MYRGGGSDFVSVGQARSDVTYRCDIPIGSGTMHDFTQFSRCTDGVGLSAFNATSIGCVLVCEVTRPVGLEELPLDRTDGTLCSSPVTIGIHRVRHGLVYLFRVKQQ